MFTFNDFRVFWVSLNFSPVSNLYFCYLADQSFNQLSFDHYVAAPVA